jgi:hypothetical protein
MIAADRAMYQAKSLGKNQISGNPRPRRTGPRRLLAAPEETPLQAPVAAAPDAGSSATAAPASSRPATNGAASVPHGEDEPDPADVRRQIAAARLNMDPDHQIRRAMDAFLSSPSARPGEIE